MIIARLAYAFSQKESPQVAPSGPFAQFSANSAAVGTDNSTKSAQWELQSNTALKILHHSLYDNKTCARQLPPFAVHLLSHAHTAEPGGRINPGLSGKSNNHVGLKLILSRTGPEQSQVEQMRQIFHRVAYN